ncbi:MAG: hypothetical protein HPY74_05945 [Firmicutes bacterium]|nr:hypothetical protein [Bacillota bacterium]
MHYIFQRTGRTPDEILSKPPGIIAFCKASMEVTIEAEVEALEKMKGVNG